MVFYDNITLNCIFNIITQINKAQSFFNNIKSFYIKKMS